MTPPTFTRSGVRVPCAATLRRYGITLAEWTAILERQHGVCAVCRGVPRSGILHIDHEHVKGWRRMKPHMRALYVRGLVCWHDNATVLSRGVTRDKLLNACTYLREYVARRSGLLVRIQPRKAAT